MGSFTQNLLLQQPTPGDPAVKNVWGVILNGNDALIDSAVAGILALNVAGNSNVILTSIAGEPDEARNADFVFSGALTGNITIFWPISVAGVFSVKNATTGGFSLTLAVNNGSGAPDGAVVVVPQGSSMNLKSNGTDVLERVSYTTFSNTPAAQQVTLRNNLGAAGQAGAENFAVDTGTANHLVAALSPAVTALTSGLTVTLTVLNANTGATDFNLNGLGAKTVYKPGTGGPVGLASGDIEHANDIVMVYDAALNSAAGGWFILGGLAITTFAGGVLTATTAMSGATFNLASAPNIVAATTIDIGNIAGNFVIVTNASGATIISDVNSNYPAGSVRKVFFSISGGSITLAQGSHLQLPSSINMPIGTGDMVEFTSFGTGWYVSGYLPFSVATKAVMQAGTDNTARVTPARVNDNDGVAKAWVVFDGTSGAIAASFNVTSVTRNGAGDYTVNFTTPFATANYAASGSVNSVASVSAEINPASAPTTATVRLATTLAGTGPTDFSRTSFIFYGRQ